MIRRAGEVYLVGAGPGDPELLTVKGLRLLQSADVVVHDRLIGHELLGHCRDDAEVIDVGKYPDHHRISQQQINQILVARAGAGLMVVRLKGGDPFVFGRGTEELQACRAAHVPCQVIPGVSSAIAGPASVGIPVTSRGVARFLRGGHRPHRSRVAGSHDRFSGVGQNRYGGIHDGSQQSAIPCRGPAGCRTRCGDAGKLRSECHAARRAGRDRQSG